MSLRVGVFTSGGDAPGMNASVRAAVRTVLDSGCRCFAIYEGFNGMVMGGDLIREMQWNDVGGILDRGGTIIGTARSAEFRTREGRRRAAYNLTMKGINALVVCGGDGSLTGADLFRREWPDLLDELHGAGQLTVAQVEEAGHLRVAGFVGTIDNDMCGTHLTIGADTALTRVVDAMDMLASTAESHRRTFVVEAMGRHCGYLALLAGVLGGADFVFFPESPPCRPDEPPWQTALCEALEARRALCMQRKMSLVVVSEGAIDCHGNAITSQQVQKAIQDTLGLDTRITILGHMQRGGPPTVTDRYVGTLMGVAAAVAVCEERPADAPPFEPVLIGIEGNRVIQSPLMDCVQLTQSVGQLMKEQKWEEAAALRCPAFQEALDVYNRITSYVSTIGRQAAQKKSAAASQLSSPRPLQPAPPIHHAISTMEKLDEAGAAQPQPRPSTPVTGANGERQSRGQRQPQLRVEDAQLRPVDKHQRPVATGSIDERMLSSARLFMPPVSATPLSVRRRSTAHAARCVSASKRAALFGGGAGPGGPLSDPFSQDPASSLVSVRSRSEAAGSSTESTTAAAGDAPGFDVTAASLPTLAGLNSRNSKTALGGGMGSGASPSAAAAATRQRSMASPLSVSTVQPVLRINGARGRASAPASTAAGAGAAQAGAGSDAIRVAVVLCGAPAPGMNAVVAYFVRSAIALGYEVIGFMDGMSGLAAGLCRPLTWELVDSWVSLGGAVLGCNRSVAGESDAAPFADIADTLATERISALVMVGGFEGYRSMHALAQAVDKFPALDVPLVCIPATISSNLPVTEHSVGCDRGVANLVEAVDKIKQSAVSMQRLFIIETMGAWCGYLAFMGGLNCGAERVYLPEEALNLRDVAADVADVRARFAPPAERARRMAADRRRLLRGLSKGAAAAAEDAAAAAALRPRLNQSMSLRDATPCEGALATRQWRQTAIFIKNERSAPLFSSSFLRNLFERESDGHFDVRVSVLGHLQQGGSPTTTDRLRAMRFANAAVGFLCHTARDGVHRFSRAPAVMLGEVQGQIVFDDLHKFQSLVNSSFRRPINQWWLGLRSLNEMLAQPWPGYSHSSAGAEKAAAAGSKANVNDDDQRRQRQETDYDEDEE